MKKWISRAVLVLALAAALVWGWWTFFPSPERVIRKDLKELAQSVSFGGNEAPLAKLANATKVASYFTGDAQVIVDVPGYSRLTLSGMDELRPAALRARQAMNSLKVDFVDISVSVADPKQTAVADVTAKGVVPGEKDFQIQELRFTFARVGRNWLIRRVETVKTLL